MSDRTALIAAFADHLNARREEALAFLGRLIDFRGGSEDAAAVRRVGQALTESLVPLGFRLEQVAAAPYAEHLVLRNHDRTDAIVLAGHMDTTFTDYDGLPAFHIDGERAVGPGTADMRGGLVVIRYALECLSAAGLLAGRPVTVVLNADEERGSPTSRRLFHELAAEARCALVFECGGERGEVVTGRRGKLTARVEIEGRAGHAAQRGAEKASAILEAAHKVIAIEALNHVREGATFNVGLIRGGIASNTVPKRAGFDFDVRYIRREDRSWIEEQVRAAMDATRVNGCRTTCTWTSERPVWESGGAAQDALLATWRDAASALGRSLPTEFRWGTSDACFFADRGVPTLDGLGPVGFEDHSEREYILLESLFERIQLTALALAGG